MQRSILNVLVFCQPCFAARIAVEEKRSLYSSLAHRRTTSQQSKTTKQRSQFVSEFVWGKIFQIFVFFGEKVCEMTSRISVQKIIRHPVSKSISLFCEIENSVWQRASRIVENNLFLKVRNLVLLLTLIKLPTISKCWAVKCTANYITE